MKKLFAIASMAIVLAACTAPGTQVSAMKPTTIPQVSMNSPSSAYPENSVSSEAAPTGTANVPRGTQSSRPKRIRLEAETSGLSGTITMFLGENSQEAHTQPFEEAGAFINELEVKSGEKVTLIIKSEKLTKNSANHNGACWIFELEKNNNSTEPKILVENSGEGIEEIKCEWTYTE